MKMKKIALFCVVVLVLLSFGGVYIFGDVEKYDFFGFGKSTSQILQNSPQIQNNNDDLSATSTEIELFKLRNEFLNIEMTEQEIEDRIFQQNAIVQEAERIGVGIDLEQAKEQVRESLRMIDDLLENGSESEKHYAQITKDNMDAYIQGLGVTEEQYIEIAAKDMQRIMAGAALEEHFRNNMASELVNDPVKLELELKAYTDEIVENAKKELNK